MATSQTRTRNQAKYDAKATTQIHLKLNNKSDADILDRLAGMTNKQGYIKQLIRDDMRRQGY